MLRRRLLASVGVAVGLLALAMAFTSLGLWLLSSANS